MKRTNSRRGIALVMVLIMIVLAATITIIFLASMGRERQGTDLSIRGSQARTLASMTVSQVMGSINAATKVGTALNPVSWASQPGMIRTFKSDGTAGDFYKLYSWDNLVEPGVGFNPSGGSEVPPGSWTSSPALFTDLNQPVNSVYPIADPDTTTLVQGFSIDASNAAVSGSGGLKAPMPTKWLYVLEQGQMVAPTGTGTTVNIPGETANNRVVGRVAFWTDDETCKVNINTASEGEYWDWPKAGTYDEMQFAGNPPIAGEYNRTPGHPAMTSISAVFPELDPGPRWTVSGGAVAPSFRSNLSSILSIMPKVIYSNLSSQGGTYPVETHDGKYYLTPTLPIPTVSLKPDTDRLFVSPDEILFQPGLDSATPPKRIINSDLATKYSSLTPDSIQKRSFFLTSSSRAPETTLFETPRISLWPVTWPYNSAHYKATAKRQTAPYVLHNPDIDPINDPITHNPNAWMRPEESLLAFDSSLNTAASNGGARYYFQRQNPESPSADYLSIKRNRDLLTYLQKLTATNVPGYGASFAGKYGAPARDTILANAFNAERSLVNQYTLNDSGATAGTMMYSYTPVAFNNFKLNDGTAKTSQNEPGAFCPIPLTVNLGTGNINTISEFPRLKEAAIVFYATARNLPVKPSPASNDPNLWTNLINVTGAAPAGVAVGAQTTSMQAVLILDFCNLFGTTRNNQPIFWAKLSGAQLSASGTSLKLTNAVAKMDYRPGLVSYLNPMFTRSATGAISGIKTLTNGNVSDLNYGLISPSIPCSSGDTTFSFSGGVVNVDIYALKDGNPALDPTSDPTLLVASYPVDFSKWNATPLPIPLSPRWNFYDQLGNTGAPPGGTVPNPRYDTFDVTKSSAWAVIEIAPVWAAVAATADPAVTGGEGGECYKFTALYNTAGAAGRISYGTAAFLFGKTIAYVAFDNAGKPVMTDYTKRLTWVKSAIGATNAFTAEGSGNSFSTGKGEYASPGGFPAITPYDTVISMVPDPLGPGNGDPRLASQFQFVNINSPNALASGTVKQVMSTTTYPRLNRQFHSLGSLSREKSATGYITALDNSLLGSTLAPNGMAMEGNQDKIVSGSTYGVGSIGAQWTDGDIVGVDTMLPRSKLGPSASVGDWSSQPGRGSDGGSLVRPDQDFEALSLEGSSYQVPYFRQSLIGAATANGLNSNTVSGNFSPNREIPSPITLLGALPSNVTKGWQTLLFSPNPADSTHPGLTGLPDHLMLDLFWMPVAEPYPISEEFSTAGKINLNYKLMPFGYINRRTGLQALMKSTWITALNESLVYDYKDHWDVKGLPNTTTRYPIDVKETLDRFDTDVFNTGDIFRSASQVCQMWLVPQGQTAASVKTFWNDKRLTSDTAREEPYNNLYSRLTTKSNTYTVHWRVQVLKKNPGAPVATWDESKDRRLSELRGSTLIERYIDPNAGSVPATAIPDYADPLVINPLPLSNYYKWRVVSENYFQP